MVRKAPSDPLKGMSSIFPLVVERAPIGILLVDDQGRILHLNPKGLQIFGYSSDEVVGKLMEILIPKTARDAHVHHRAGFMQDPQARAMGKGRYLTGLHKKGHDVPVEIGLVPLKTSNGMMVLATILDITAQAEKKQLEQDLLHVIEMEQKRIGQDLHDSLGQQLLAISFLCSVLKKKLAAGTTPDPSEAAHIEDLVGEAKMNVRKLTRGLYAGDLETRGLGACIRTMTEHMQEITAVCCRFEGDDTLMVADRSKSENLFRLAQEALNNAAKHSLATTIVVALSREGSTLTLRVRDDGVGFVPKKAIGKGIGLRSMRYRANVMGGTFELKSHPGKGTEMSCQVRLP